MPDDIRFYRTADTYDRFWGDGGDGWGKNWLGRILMEVREELRQPAGRAGH